MFSLCLCLISLSSLNQICVYILYICGIICACVCLHMCGCMDMCGGTSDLLLAARHTYLEVVCPRSEARSRFNIS